MTLLLLAAALPALFWDAAVDTAPLVREAGITRISVPPEQVQAWRAVAGLTVTPADLRDTEKLIPPAVGSRPNVASPTSNPWINANGWRFLRNPSGRFLYDVRGNQAALAAAEAFAYGVAALIRTDAAGLKPLAEMLRFLESLPPSDLPPLANIAFLDDGSAAAGELMNLLLRGNLLLRASRSPGPKLDVNVRFGSPDYPAGQDPYLLVGKVRSELTDEKRLVRLFGSGVVLARATGSGGRMRLHLVHYAARRVDGLRIRVLGRFSKSQVAAFDNPQAKLLDPLLEPRATELTLSELMTYAVIDLSR